MRFWQAVTLTVLAAHTPVMAETPEPALEELVMLKEYPVNGLPQGNLSGIALCNNALWAVTDRDDDRIFQLQKENDELNAVVETFTAPAVPRPYMSWGMGLRNKLAGLIRGGHFDFEGITCDEAGNRYLVSEMYSAVLKLDKEGQTQWLKLPSLLIPQARASGMLLHYNAQFEGIAISPSGDRLWLAAERQKRGLLAAQRFLGNDWQCEHSCVLISEDNRQPAPAELGGQPQHRDFSDLVYFNGHLYTLERLAHRICRRSTDTGEAERCWSFADETLTPERRYDSGYGVAEALWIDHQGAWIGIDNGKMARGDGDSRPMLWRFSAPKNGWGARG